MARSRGNANWVRRVASSRFTISHTTRSRPCCGTSAWDISDFGAPWPRGRIPADADPSELIVGFLDTERASGTRWNAADFNDKAALYYAEHSPGTTPPTLTDDDLAQVRQRRAQLFAEWDAVPPGGTLELTFDVGADATTSARRTRSSDGTRPKTRAR